MRVRPAVLVLLTLTLACSDGNAPQDGGIVGDSAADKDTGDVSADKGSAARDSVSNAVKDDAMRGCSAEFAGCQTFEDFSEDSANRTIEFTSFQYAPKCMQIKVGQSVIFSGNFASHPLRQSCGPTFVTFAVAADGQTRSFTFDEAGDYGFFCHFHGGPEGQAMSGALRVVP